MVGSSQRRIRKRVARGVYEDQWGLSALVRAGGQRREQRFPPGTSMRVIRQWIDETRVRLRLASARAARGTFSADAERYLAAVSAMPTFKERRAHIELWKAEFGQRRRDTIQTVEIDAVLQRWLGAGLAASTVRHRRTALQHLWSLIDGKASPNPARGSTAPAEPEPEPRGLPYETVEAILGAMPDRGQAVKGRPRDAASKTKARLAVIAYTGIPHKQIMELRPRDVRWDSGTVFVKGRRKGKGTKGHTLPLTALALEALRRFDELDCWGAFSGSSMWKSFQRACATLGLAGLRPYDFRHSFGTAVYAATGDPRATQHLLAHASQKMTERYTLAAVPERLRIAVGALDKAQRGTKKVAVRGGSTRPVLVRSTN